MHKSELIPVILLLEKGQTLSPARERLETVLPEQNILVVIAPEWERGSERSWKEFLQLLAEKENGVTIATTDHVIMSQAHELEIDVIENRKELKNELDDHADATLAMRCFSHGLLEKVWSDSLLRIKKLSVSRLRIWALLIASIILFVAVIFIALPNATVKVWPRIGVVSHTANVLLVSSGSSLTLDRGQNTIELKPMIVTVERSLTFDQVSKNFTGENAQTLMKIINEVEEQYSFRKGTRLVNQAGMIFRIMKSVSIPAAKGLEPGTANVYAEAQPEDLYGEIVGERGNIPAGLRWEIPGLQLAERVKVYARNIEEATGGVTRYGNLVQEKDLELARAQIEQELLRAARFRIDEEIEALRAKTGDHFMIFSGAQYEVLTQTSFSGITIPTQLVGENVGSIPIEGELTYTMLAYNKDALLKSLKGGLETHVEKGYNLVSESVLRDRVAVYVIEYDDDLSWVKVTADLTGKQRAILSALTSEGRIFQERLRGMVKGKSIDEARRIIQNFEEVDHVKISVWPPWHRSLPTLANHIVITPIEE